MIHQQKKKEKKIYIVFHSHTLLSLLKVDLNKKFFNHSRQVFQS